MEWHWLRPHHQRDAVWVVAPALGLETVVMAVAGDDKEAVQRWLVEGVLSRPTAEQVAVWDADPLRLLAMVIVQPFVFVKEL